MEPLAEDQLLRDLSSFLGRGLGSSFSSVVTVYSSSKLRLQFSVELKERGTSRAVDRDENWSYSFNSQSAAGVDQVPRVLYVGVVRALADCSAWTHGRFVFGPDDPGILDDLVLEVFRVLRSSRSLCALEVELAPFCHRHLPIVVCGNRTLEALTVSPGAAPPHPVDTEAIAACFARNSVLKSCTLGANYSVTSQAWESMLRPFTIGASCEANVALKELVIRIHSYSACQDALANLVRCNTTLERLEILAFYSDFHFRSLAQALAGNRTLKDFGCVWSVVHWAELVEAFIPGSSDYPVNTHLKTLKLFPLLESEAEFFMKELCRISLVNTTLEHVAVVPVAWMKSERIGEDGYATGLRDVVLGHRGVLERMMTNELTLNTSLRSLVLGYWKLLRVGVEWQMSYVGPCVSTKVPTAEYDVKVKIIRQ